MGSVKDSEGGKVMLRLKRVIYFNDFLKCDISGDIISYGDYYYEDDEDGLIVKADVYHALKEEKKAAEFDYSKLNKAQSMLEYSEMLKEYERQLKAKTLFDRQVEGEGIY